MPRASIVSVDVLPHGGGKSSHVSEFQAGLWELGWSVEVRSPASVNRLKRLATAGVRLRRGDIAGFYDTLGRQVAELISSCDLVFAEDVVMVEPAIAKGVSKRIALVVHGDFANERVDAGLVRRGSVQAQRLLDMERAAYIAADRIVTVDFRLRRHVEDACGRTDAVVVPNFVGEELFGKSRLPPQGLVFMVPRRLVPKNGVNVAIAALAKLPGAYRLQVAGDGPQLTALRELAERLGVRERVEFLGSLPRGRVIEMMRRATGVVVPSVPSAGVIEATSIAALEASALGVPVIASKLGGLAEIYDGTPAERLLCPPGDSSALADAMLAVGHGLYRDQAADMRKLIKERYSRAAGVSRLLEAAMSR